jgi:hypothetical protein
MEHQYEVEFHGTRMNAENLREDLYREMLRPFYMLKPAVFPDGSRWCALHGPDLQAGVAGFGDTPEQAAINFDVNWKNQKLTSAKDVP